MEVVLKEKSFKFRESFANAIKEMDDIQVGKLIKAICDYVFYDRCFESCDGMLNSVYSLFKILLDNEKRDRENGRKGGILSAKKNKKEDLNINVVAHIEQKSHFEEDWSNTFCEKKKTKDGKVKCCKNR